jgi:thioredoxin:protein disulfide reductase
MGDCVIISLRNMTFWLILSSLWLGVFKVYAQPEPFDVPLEQLKRKDPENVVRFVVEKADGNDALVRLETRGGFKIYEKGLEFHDAAVATETGALLGFTANPFATVIEDTFYNEKRAVHYSGAVFKVHWSAGKPWVFNVRFEACSIDMCLLPTWFKLQFLDGARGVRIKKPSEEQGEVFENAGSAQQVSKVTRDLDSIENFAPVQKNESPKEALSQEVQPKSSLSDQASYWVQNSLTNRSWWLFPALLLAGLLMNLTPCVYPMIPITLNVLSTFGVARASGHEAEKSRNRKFLPFLYVLGMVLSYTAMGVVAGMTGTLFGSLLQSVYVTVALAIVMFLLGLSMLGVFNMTAIQSFAARIPIAEKYPKVGVVIMGALSGLVSAPCTGPVLSMILLLIGKSKDPIYGFVLMAFFSFGFGAPYIFLGLFTQKLGRLPKAGAVLNGVKTIFAALMFALALYYIKPILVSFAALQFVFAKPSLGSVAAFVLTIVVCELTARLQPKISQLTRVVSLIASTALALWFTLFVTSGFVLPQEFNSEVSSTTQTTKVVEASKPGTHVAWEQKWEVAKVRAAVERKPVLVDLWAEWCAACLKMDATVWSDPVVVKLINEKFVAVKIDFTRSTPFTEMLTEKWEISGLPAVGFFRFGENLDLAPQKFFREAVTIESFNSAAKEILAQKGDVQ